MPVTVRFADGTEERIRDGIAEFVRDGVFVVVRPFGSADWRRDPKEMKRALIEDCGLPLKDVPRACLLNLLKFSLSIDGPNAWHR